MESGGTRRALGHIDAEDALEEGSLGRREALHDVGQVNDALASDEAMAQSVWGLSRKTPPVSARPPWQA